MWKFVGERRLRLLDVKYILRPEYVKRLKEIEKEDTVKVRDIDKYFETLRKK